MCTPPNDWMSTDNDVVHQPTRTNSCPLVRIIYISSVSTGCYHQNYTVFQLCVARCVPLFLWWYGAADDQFNWCLLCVVGIDWRTVHRSLVMQYSSSTASCHSVDNSKFREAARLWFPCISHVLRASCKPCPPVLIAPKVGCWLHLAQSMRNWNRE